MIDLDAVRGAGLRLGVDPMGGAGVHYWQPIADRYHLDLTVVSEVVDETFAFMSLDWDGKIRMDPSSPHAMQRLIGLKDQFDIAFACDTDHDRHGVVTRSTGLVAAQSLPRGDDRAPVRASPRMVWPGRRRQDRGEQQHDRSRHHRRRPRPVRGAGRLQVVRRRIVRRLARVRRRGECGCVVPASRWHRCGRPTRTASFRRCLRRRSRPSLVATRESSIGTLPGAMAIRCMTESKRPQRLPRRRAWRSCPPTRSPVTRWPASQSSRSSAMLPETARHSAASRSRPRRAGSPHVLRAPRTSTRSTSNRSAAARTSTTIVDEAQAIVNAALA